MSETAKEGFVKAMVLLVDLIFRRGCGGTDHRDAVYAACDAFADLGCEERDPNFAHWGSGSWEECHARCRAELRKECGL